MRFSPSTYLMGAPQLVHLSVLVISGDSAFAEILSGICAISPTLPSGTKYCVYYGLK